MDSSCLSGGPSPTRGQGGIVLEPRQGGQGRMAEIEGGQNWVLWGVMVPDSHVVVLIEVADSLEGACAHEVQGDGMGPAWLAGEHGRAEVAWGHVEGAALVEGWGGERGQGTWREEQGRGWREQWGGIGRAETCYRASDEVQGGGVLGGVAQEGGVLEGVACFQVVLEVQGGVVGVFAQGVLQEVLVGEGDRTLGQASKGVAGVCDPEGDLQRGEYHQLPP